MSTFHKYPELVRLEKRPEILSVKQAVATEKLHGSNFRVLFPAGMTSLEEVRFGGRNEAFDGSDTGFYGGRPVRWFREQPGLLERMQATFASYGFSDVIVYGEICGSGIQKGVRYAAPGEILFRAFDICVGDNFVTYDLFVEICEKIPLPRVPEIWRGEPSIDAFDALLEKQSAEAIRNGITDGDNISEGVVIRSTPLLRNVFGEWLIIKHKSENFAEVAKRGPKPETNLSAADEFVATFVLPGRVLNALGRLKDRGVKIEGDLRDMAHLVRALFDDLHKECDAEWQAVLARGLSDKQLRGVITKALGATYRKMLVDKLR